MKKYGLIGYPLSHSFSKLFFEEKFAKEGISDASYGIFPLPVLTDAKIYLAQEQGLSGFNITIPHKKNIIPLLDKASDAVKATGACNCVQLEAGKWYGFNTDVIGFEQSLKPFLKKQHTKALILGTGGAAVAVAYVLQKLGITHHYVSRRKTNGNFNYADIDALILSEHLLIINATPLGMYPDIYTYPPIPYHMLTPQHHLFDLVYNPAETIFLQKGAAQNATVQNGYEMLVIQAEASWTIWNDPEFDKL